METAYADLTLGEADTRAKLIDPTLHQGRFRGLRERAIKYLKEDTAKKGPSS